MLAVDSSVLYLIFKAQPMGSAWLEYLIAAAAADNLVICEVVYAELVPFCSSKAELQSRFQGLAITFDSINPQSAYAAGATFKDYRRRGGPRSSMIPDFLVAAHAQHQTDGLIAADRGYLRTFFSGLRVFGLEPSD